jgi:hypothetical protein
MVSALFLFMFALSPAAHANNDFAFDTPAGIRLLPLFSITSDRDTIVNVFNLMIDGKNRAGGVLVRPNPNKLGVTADHAFWMRDIESPAGVALAEEQGLQVLTLQGQIDSATQEGRFHAKYLSNGLTGSYKSCDFLLKRSADGWYVKNAYNGRTVTTMKVVSWTLGISTLQGICN